MHEQIMGRLVQPMARRHGPPHITWRLLRHRGTTLVLEADSKTNISSMGAQTAATKKRWVM